MTQKQSIAFDRRIDIEWLDAAAAQIAAGTEVEEARAALFQLLEGKVAGGRKKGLSCHKTVGILSRAWITVAPEIVSLRDRAVRLLPSLEPHERVALHWSLLTAGFPFFGDLAATAGRLLNLQGNFSLAQLIRRLRETWGDRSTMSTAAPRIVRSMVQWEVLKGAEERGNYTGALQATMARGELAELLLEGLLIHQGRAVSIEQVTGHPALFPFGLELHAHRLRQSAQFDVHRQGLNTDVVQLAS
ncbi:hypothetical protein ACFL17_07655 [Pseudomonadota bacterium]